MQSAILFYRLYPSVRPSVQVDILSKRMYISSHLFDFPVGASLPFFKKSNANPLARKLITRRVRKICDIDRNRRLYRTRRLATGSRSRASAFVSPNVFKAGHGWSCKKFPRTKFDHHAKFSCCFSCCVREWRRSQNLGTLWTHIPKFGSVAAP